MMMGLMDRHVPQGGRHSAAVGSRRNVKRMEPSVDGHSDMNFNMEFSKIKNERAWWSVRRVWRSALITSTHLPTLKMTAFQTVHHRSRAKKKRGAHTRRSAVTTSEVEETS